MRPADKLFTDRHRPDNELVHKRSLTGKVFDNGDGTETLRSSLSRVHYGPTRSMSPVDTRFRSQGRVKRITEADFKVVTFKNAVGYVYTSVTGATASVQLLPGNDFKFTPNTRILTKDNAVVWTDPSWKFYFRLVAGTDPNKAPVEIFKIPKRGLVVPPTTFNWDVLIEGTGFEYQINSKAWDKRGRQVLMKNTRIDHPIAGDRESFTHKEEFTAKVTNSRLANPLERAFAPLHANDYPVTIDATLSEDTGDSGSGNADGYAFDVGAVWTTTGNNLIAELDDGSSGSPGNGWIGLFFDNIDLDPPTFVSATLEYSVALFDGEARFSGIKDSPPVFSDGASTSPQGRYATDGTTAYFDEFGGVGRHTKDATAIVSEMVNSAWASGGSLPFVVSPELLSAPSDRFMLRSHRYPSSDEAAVLEITYNSDALVSPIIGDKEVTRDIVKSVVR